MARIRTVKPELFRHEELFEAEKRTGLPLRLAWIGLFTVADKEGRFKWRPRSIKCDILPYDETDPSRILDEFVTMGLLIRYRDGEGAEYGAIPTWKLHQRPRNDEAASTCPNPNDCEVLTVAVTDSSRTRHSEVTNPPRGKEVERKGKGSGSGKELSAGTSPAAPGDQGEDLRRSIWAAYREAYLERYGVEPVRNATVNGQIRSIAQRLGAHAPEVVKFYVRHPDPFFARNTHSIGLCLKQAESLFTQWQKGRAITPLDVKRYEKAQEYQDLMASIERDGV
jgi:hypothetical protein